jgi:1,4-dihydroxy-2-naphthoate octaprenyltransferase
MATAKAWIQEIRAPFLILTPISVFVGAAVAAYEGWAINAGYLAIAMVGAVLAHIAVNVINEYYDYQSGVDFKTVRTPFSGGSGILVQGLVSPRAAFMLGIACIAAILGIGWYFFTVHGAGIIPLGILGVIVLYFYTTHITKSPLLCAIAPGLGFGPLMVMGTYFSLTGTYSLAAGLASLVPAFLVSNLLLLNQFPDVEADKLVNRRHLPIVIGRKNSSLVYAALLGAAYVALVASVAAGVLPPLALLGLITLPLGWVAVRGARRYHDQIEKLIPTMATNVLLTLALPLLMAVGMVIAVVIG